MHTWQTLKAHPALWSRYLIREKVIAAIREFFTKQRFREIEVPLLTPTLLPESYVEVFETTLLDRHRRGQRAFLTTSPELFLKKLLAAGIGNCFTITKSFRNTETGSNLHNPEFTLLEWYRVGEDYRDLMRDAEELFSFIYQKLYSSSEPASQQASREASIKTKENSRFARAHSNGNNTLVYQGQTIDLTPPWERLSMSEAFVRYAQVRLEHALQLSAMRNVAGIKGYRLSPKTTWEELFHQIYLNEVEPHLGQGRPTIIYDFPSQVAALAKKKIGDPRFCERFEVYIAGLELGDCYSELTDWQEQEARFKNEVVERRRLGKIDYPYDQDFIEALKVGLPKCAGLALGVDRLVMLFADAKRIQDVLLFPAEELWKET